MWKRVHEEATDLSRLSTFLLSMSLSSSKRRRHLYTFSSPHHTHRLMTDVSAAPLRQLPHIGGGAQKVVVVVRRVGDYRPGEAIVLGKLGLIDCDVQPGLSGAESLPRLELPKDHPHPLSNVAQPG